MKVLLIALLALVLSACEPPVLVIYNGCNGSFVRVRDGEGRVLVERLPFGQETGVNLKARQGQNVTLLASGFSLTDARPMGSASHSVYVPSSYSSTGPDQIYPWTILWLQSTDIHGGCLR